MKNGHISDSDRSMIAGQGITESEVLRQIDLLKQGHRFISLNRPCTTGDGVLVIEEDRFNSLAATHEAAQSKGRTMKFVPASGAASRMFEQWFRLRYSDDQTEQERFLANLPRYPFYSIIRMALKEALSGEMNSGEQCRDIIDYILTERGLSYGILPKALIVFHQYGDESRTALEEQLAEAVLHTADRRHICRIHFTLSPEHRQLVENHFHKVQGAHEKRFSVSFQGSFSIQSPSTNTIALAMDGAPFRNESGSLLFRPGGHGSLLENLNGLGEDIVFIKNIDNITPDHIKNKSIMYKKVLCGYLLEIQAGAFQCLELIDKGLRNASELTAIEDFCRNRLSLRPPRRFERFSFKEKADYLFTILNRPIRVCGMVRNEGEPGGGPFWINDEDGSQSLQIVEKNQIDSNSKEQVSLWNASTHFNPVDLVCGLRDYRGHPFDLYDFRDRDSYMVSVKSYQGRNLKALEHPGLWNGSMAFWNTIFVEVPLSTFAPVKTIEDLLRPEHCMEGH